MYRPVEDELKHNVQNESHGKQRADGRHPASQQFLSTSGVEEQAEQVGRVSRLASVSPPRNPSRMASTGCRMKRMRPGPVNRCGSSSRNCRENRHTRPVSMVSAIQTEYGRDHEKRQRRHDLFSLFSGSRVNAAPLPPSSARLASSRPKSWMVLATSPVQPVWWLAPSPAPLSPWKYS
jgi:hypothetical protein